MILRLDHVQKNYGDFKLDCSMEVKEGMVTGLIGANGAGKSTTFKTILNLIKTDGGEIELFDQVKKELSMQDKEDLGIVLPESGFSGYLTIKDIVPVLEGMYKRFDRKKFLEECERAELPLKKRIMEMSTGMKAKLKVLIAMSHEAKLLILDEPTAGLDVLAREDLLDSLRRYMETEGRAILISSHISSDLEGFCDDIYMIHKGSMVFHEDTDVLLSDYGVLKVDEEKYEKLDKQYILYEKKESYGYCLLTNRKEYYTDNYPGVVMEKGTIDDVISLMAKGEKR